MGRQHLIIVSGVPGAGKSTFARRAVDRWGAVSFASETFADELGPAARSMTGDLTPEAIAHAYAAMGAAAASALAEGKFVVVVGSFRSVGQRQRFRDVAKYAGASVTTLRIVCPVEIASQRVVARGERGPDEKAIRQIDAQFAGADDIDAVLANDSSIEHFHQRLDAIMERLAPSLGLRK